MPELSFFMTPDDEVLVVDWFLARGCRLVPARRYDVPAVEELATLEAYRAAKGATPGGEMYVVSPELLESPFELQPIDRPEGRRYVIMQRKGGPALSFSSRSPIQEADHVLLPGGSLAYYPSYWSTRLARRLPAPPALKQLYADAAALIKRGAVRILFGPRTYYATPAAVEAARRGDKLGPLPRELEIPPGAKMVKKPWA